MSIQVNSSPFFGKSKSSYEYYHWKIMSEKQTDPKPGDVYEKIGHTLPGVHNATYLVKKRGNTYYNWNKARKFFCQAHGNIVIKYERINITGGNVHIYLDEKPITAHMYKWADWGREFKFVGKIWNGLEPGTIVKDKNIELVEDMARRLAYEDPKNKEEWKLRRIKKEEAEEEAEARTKWLNSDDGRLWQLQRNERKKIFDKYHLLHFYRTKKYPKTIQGKLIQEEDERWREEYDRQQADQNRPEIYKRQRERLAREAEEKRRREEKMWKEFAFRPTYKHWVDEEKKYFTEEEAKAKWLKSDDGKHWLDFRFARKKAWESQGDGYATPHRAGFSNPIAKKLEKEEEERWKKEKEGIKSSGEERRREHIKKILEHTTEKKTYDEWIHSPQWRWERTKEEARAGMEVERLPKLKF